MLRSVLFNCPGIFTNKSANPQLDAAIKDIITGKCPKNYQHFLEPRNPFLAASIRINNQLSNSQRLSPLEKLYLSILAIRDFSPANSNISNMIRLQHSTRRCWFGNNEPQLIVNNQIMASSNENKFDLVAQLFSDSGSLVKIEIIVSDSIVITLPESNSSEFVLLVKVTPTAKTGNAPCGMISSNRITMISLDGASFIGSFKDGMMGNGTMKYSNGDIFIGSFKDGETETGVLTPNNRPPLVFEMGKLKNGNGDIVYPNGDKFTGSFEKGERKYGDITCSDGSKFSGNFSKGIPKDGTLTIGGKTLNARLPRTEDYFITEVVIYSIRESNSSFIKWYVERFIPGNVYPESTLNEIIAYYTTLKEMSMQILALPHQPKVEDIISRGALSERTQVVVIKTQDSSDYLEIYSLQYFLNVMTKYIINLILTRDKSTSYSTTPLSRTPVVENLVPPDKTEAYANSFKENQYNYIPDAEPLPALKLTLEIEHHTDDTT